MLTSEIHLLGYGPAGLTRRVQFLIRSDAGGVGLYEVRNSRGIIGFAKPVSASCAPAVLFELEIAVTNFPVSVRASECVNGEDGHVLGDVPLHDPGGANQPPEPTTPMCSPLFGMPPSARCTAAKREALERRNRVLEQCTNVRRARDRFWGSLAVVLVALAGIAIFTTALIFTIAAAAAATASVFGFALGILYGALAIIFAAVVAWFTYLFIRASIEADRARRDWEAAELDLRSAQEEFRRAAMDVATSCCPGDFTDIEVTLPSCP